MIGVEVVREKTSSNTQKIGTSPNASVEKLRRSSSGNLTKKFVKIIPRHSIDMLN